MTSLFRALSVVLLPRTAVPLNGKLFRLDSPPYHCMTFSLVENYESYIHVNLQVEVSGGRGKPSTNVNSDEGLGKVLPFHSFMHNTVFRVVCTTLGITNFHNGMVLSTLSITSHGFAVGFSQNASYQ